VKDDLCSTQHASSGFQQVKVMFSSAVLGEVAAAETGLPVLKQLTPATLCPCRFGHIGDSRGRRVTLLWSILCVSVSAQAGLCQCTRDVDFNTIGQAAVRSGAALLAAESSHQAWLLRLGGTHCTGLCVRTLNQMQSNSKTKTRRPHWQATPPAICLKTSFAAAASCGSTILPS
jgi:hypothetical protein